MKKRLTPILITLLLTGCTRSGLYYASLHYDWEKTFALSHQDTIVDLPIDNIHTIEYNGNFPVELVQAHQSVLTLKADKALLNRFRYRLTNNKLVFYFSRGARLPQKSVSIRIAASDIRQINKQGSGNLYIKGGTHQAELSLKQSGSGRIRGQLNTSLLTGIVNGSGRIELSGAVAKTSLKTHGSGQIWINGKKQTK